MPSAFCRDSGGMTSYYLTDPLAFHNPPSKARHCESATNRRTTPVNTHSSKRNNSSLYWNPPQPPTSWVVKFLPDKEEKKTIWRMTFQIFSEGRKGKEGGRAVFNDVVMSHHHPSAYLVWLCTHCPQSIWPIQSRRSCILVHSPLECLLIADLCGCNSCVRCKPFLQQPVEVERMEHVTPWLDVFTHHYF